MPLYDIPHFHGLSDSHVAYCKIYQRTIANKISSRCRPHLQLPLSQSALRPPVRWAPRGKRYQAGRNGSPGPAWPDVASFSVGHFPPSALQPSAALHRTPAPDLSGSQRNSVKIFHASKIQI